MKETSRWLHPFQQVLLFFYRFVRRSGLLHYSWSQRCFVALYNLYKRHSEDPYIALLGEYPFLFQKGSVLDIGANIGYTAMLFGETMTTSFKVYAFEPEPWNVELLRSTVHRRGLDDRICIVPSAVGQMTHNAELWVNPGSHADHRMVTSSFRPGIQENSIRRVSVISIDDFLSKHPEASPIGFIKIDVQGFEEAVCRGMERTLAANPEAVVSVEFYPEAIISLGFRPEGLLQFFEERRYVPHRLTRHGLVRVNPESLRQQLPCPGYVDIVYSKCPLTKVIAPE